MQITAFSLNPIQKSENKKSLLKSSRNWTKLTRMIAKKLSTENLRGVNIVLEVLWWMESLIWALIWVCCKVKQQRNLKTKKKSRSLSTRRKESQMLIQLFLLSSCLLPRTYCHSSNWRTSLKWVTPPPISTAIQKSKLPTCSKKRKQRKQSKVKAKRKLETT